MMRPILAAFALAAMTATAALADRPVSADERAKLVELLSAQGCSGGEMEFDDGKFEIDDARCADGKKWDFEYDQNFKLIKKKLED